VTMSLESAEGPLQVKSDNEWKETGAHCIWKIIKVAEVRIPLEQLNPAPGDNLFAYFTLMRGEEELGRWPSDSPLLLKYAGPDLELETWII
jgi:hypothetical protein